MNKIEKFLSRLSEKEKKLLENILLQLKNNRLTGLDIKKLKGYNDVFRVRKGDIRIIYVTREDSVFILTIERRSEKTYK